MTIKKRFVHLVLLGLLILPAFAASFVQAATLVHMGERATVTSTKGTVSFVPGSNKVIFGPVMDEDYGGHHAVQAFAYAPTDAPTADEFHTSISSGFTTADFVVMWFEGSVDVEDILGSTVHKEDGTDVTYGAVTGKEYIGVTPASFDAYIFEDAGYTVAVINSRGALSTPGFRRLCATVRVF